MTQPALASIVNGGVHVAGTQGAPFQIAELVEHEQRMVTDAAEMAVVGRALLLAMCRAVAFGPFGVDRVEATNTGRAGFGEIRVEGD